jgi:hypothetical protein
VYSCREGGLRLSQQQLAERTDRCGRIDHLERAAAARL